MAFGVLTTNTAEEALARAGDGPAQQGARSGDRRRRDGAAVRPADDLSGAATRRLPPSAAKAVRDQTARAIRRAKRRSRSCISGKSARRDRRRGARGVLSRARAGCASDASATFASELVRGTVATVAAIDRSSSRHSANWRLDRLAVIDRLILRMATWELLAQPETPPAVVIDEAIELARTFSDRRRGAIRQRRARRAFAGRSSAETANRS